MYFIHNDREWIRNGLWNFWMQCSKLRSSIRVFFAVDVDGLAETQPPGSKHYKHSRCEVLFETKLICLKI
jgi:hypothetical protein